jgi:hypothetical protein
VGVVNVRISNVGYPTMEKPLIYADFNNADARGRLRLNCAGTTDDLAQQGVSLREGMQLILHDEELEADGIAQYSSDDQLWVAAIDWQKLRRQVRQSSGQR